MGFGAPWQRRGGGWGSCWLPHTLPKGTRQSETRGLSAPPTPPNPQRGPRYSHAISASAEASSREAWDSSGLDGAPGSSSGPASSWRQNGRGSKNWPQVLASGSDLSGVCRAIFASLSLFSHL